MSYGTCNQEMNRDGHDHVIFVVALRITFCQMKRNAKKILFLFPFFWKSKHVDKDFGNEMRLGTNSICIANMCCKKN